MKWLDDLLGKKSLSEIAHEAVQPYGEDGFTFDEKEDAIVISDKHSDISATLSKTKGGYHLDRSHGSTTDHLFDQKSSVKAIEQYFDVG